MKDKNVRHYATWSCCNNKEYSRHGATLVFDWQIDFHFDPLNFETLSIYPLNLLVSNFNCFKHFGPHKFENVPMK